MTISPSRLAALSVGGTAVAAALALAWFAGFGESSRLLPPGGQAEWIVYPAPPSTVAHDATPNTAVFEKTFTLAAAPASAPLRVRAFAECAVELNGTAMTPPETDGWRGIRTDDVARHLRVGTNVVRVSVTNRVGPPALWLVLAAGDIVLRTDDTWQVTLNGAAQRPARPASVPAVAGAGNPLADSPSTVSGLAARWHVLLGLAATSAVLVGSVYFSRRWSAAGEFTGRERRLVLGGLAVAWLVLVGNNLRAVPFPLGFDVNYHLEYVRYIQERRALPLATEGWEMHQPPLYYIVAAVLLHFGGLFAGERAAGVWLRAFSGLLGVVQVLLLFGCLRTLFPGQRRAVAAGLLLAAFVPVQLYLFQYATNEALATVLATASVYLALRILAEDNRSAGRHARLGLCLGAALLTKVTALAVVAVVFVALGARLLARRERRIGVWLRTVGVTALISLDVGGWHLVRAWAHFGTPLVGNYDPASGFDWWEEPGYATAGSLAGFGRALVRPFFSAFDSLPDGLYSSLWGDGQCGGAVALDRGPPWDYELMAAGYLLALVPTFLVAVGAAVAVVRFIRQPRADWFLVGGVAAALGAAVVYQYVRYPYYGHAKAFYGLAAVVALCASGALGFDVLARRLPALGIALAVALGAWALTAYASFWVRAGAAATQTWLARQWLDRGDTVSGMYHYEEALHADANAARARVGLAQVLAGPRPAQAEEQVAAVLRDRPDDADARFTLAVLRMRAGRPQEAITELRRLVAAAPDYTPAYRLLAQLLYRAGRKAEAIEAYRQALATSPYDDTLRKELAQALAKK